ncbi:MAG: hypothetical protein VW713_05185 [Alphaproteobacteria bacterium]
MKVSAGRVDSFVANPDPSIIAYLVYGPNPGLALERAQRLILTVVEDPSDPFRVAELSPSAISDTPSRLNDENTWSLFATHLIRCQDRSRTHSMPSLMRRPRRA